MQFLVSFHSIRNRFAHVRADAIIHGKRSLFLIIDNWTWLIIMTAGMQIDWRWWWSCFINPDWCDVCRQIGLRRVEWPTFCDTFLVQLNAIDWNDAADKSKQNLTCYHRLVESAVWRVISQLRKKTHKNPLNGADDLSYYNLRSVFRSTRVHYVSMLQNP